MKNKQNHGKIRKTKKTIRKKGPPKNYKTHLNIINNYFFLRPGDGGGLGFGHIVPLKGLSPFKGSIREYNRTFGIFYRNSFPSFSRFPEGYKVPELDRKLREAHRKNFLQVSSKSEETSPHTLKNSIYAKAFSSLQGPIYAFKGACKPYIAI